MTAAAEHVRAQTLKALADAAMTRAEALGAELESIWDAGGEPGPELAARFEAEVAETERLLLEYSLAGSDAVVEGKLPHSNAGNASSNRAGKA